MVRRDGHGFPGQRVEAERHAAHHQRLASSSFTIASENVLLRAMASTASSARRACFGRRRRAAAWRRSASSSAWCRTWRTRRSGWLCSPSLLRASLTEGRRAARRAYHGATATPLGGSMPPLHAIWRPLIRVATCRRSSPSREPIPSRAPCRPRWTLRRARRGHRRV
jgi:hypothetical protein